MVGYWYCEATEWGSKPNNSNLYRTVHVQYLTVNQQACEGGVDPGHPGLYGVLGEDGEGLLAKVVPPRVGLASPPHQLVGQQHAQQPAHTDGGGHKRKVCGLVMTAEMTVITLMGDNGAHQG